MSDRLDLRNVGDAALVDGWHVLVLRKDPATQVSGGAMLTLCATRERQDTDRLEVVQLVFPAFRLAKELPAALLRMRARSESIENALRAVTDIKVETLLATFARPRSGPDR
jgi:hypothetical protein